MSNMMPVERLAFAQFGALTAVDITPGSIIALEIRSGWQPTQEDLYLLHQRVATTFPDNVVMIIDSDKLGIKVMDPVPAEVGTAVGVQSAASTSFAGAAVFLAVHIVRRIFGRRAV